MKSEFESLGRLRLQAILLLGGIFLIGVLAGVAFERASGSHGHQPHGAPPQGLPPGLTDGMHLTADQETRIKEILEQGRPRTDAVLQQFRPLLRALADSVRAEIRVVLTPEQQKIFDRRQPPLPGDGGRPPFPGGPHGRPPGLHGRGGPPPDEGPPPDDGPPPGDH